jgi:glycogen debranching enzyme
VIPLKSDFCYAILDDRGMAGEGVRAAGFYRHDTRHLSRYVWTFADLELIDQTATATTLTQYWSRMRRHAQEVMLERKLEVLPTGLVEQIHVESWSDEAITLDLRLELAADFVDIFEVRGRKRRTPRNAVEEASASGARTLAYVAQDGVRSETWVKLDGLGEALQLEPRESLTRHVEIAFATTLPAGLSAPAATPRWTPSIEGERSPVLQQAVRDVESLLLETAEGRTIAAGIPNFVVPFGRDSLLTAWLLLDADPSLARSVLTYLAARQGRREDPFHDEEPGKIMHEHRESELSRIGEMPFRTYYGSADSTPLFIVLLGDYVNRTGDTALAQELEPNWRSAIRWIERYADPRGLINFRQRDDGHGLTVQSWKDSADSMSYGDGRLAEGGLAVAEVQGYVFAALNAAVDLSRRCGGLEAERRGWSDRAAKLAETVDRLFWMPDRQTYALALDADGRQLDVVASDAGHLLWSGIVPEAKAPAVIARLFADDMWSGYGLRTLSTKEKRYNPLSYHNGSVWPHDTALFAAGLDRYGDHEGFARVREGLTALARHSADLRLPELVGGYAREGSTPPLPYTESCRPQAWAAAALIYVTTRPTAPVPRPDPDDTPAR